MNKETKLIWISMWVIMVVSILALLGNLCIAAFIIPAGVWQLVMILGSCILFLIPCFYALQLEISVGAYKCKNCGNKIIPTYKQALNAMHSARRSASPLSVKYFFTPRTLSALGTFQIASSSSMHSI